MNEIHENLLKNFISKNKVELADNGFSNKVIANLPTTEKNEWVVWIFALAGLLMTIIIGLNSGFIQKLLQSLQYISIYYLAASAFTFPFIALFAICKMQFCKLKYI